MALRGAGLSCNVNTARKLDRQPRFWFDTSKRRHCSSRCYSSQLTKLAFGSGRTFCPRQVCLTLRKWISPPLSRPTSRLLSLSPCQVKSDDTEGTVTNDGISFDEQTLKQDLQTAIEEENYAQAAKIRDRLRALHEDSKASVLSANARFYESFRQGDLAGMQNLWAKSENACCVHPGAKGITGYELVMESWEIVWMSYDFPLQIELKDVEVHVRGSMGYVTCMEFVKTKGSSWGAQFATNVFERIDGEWFICVHHASPVDL